MKLIIISNPTNLADEIKLVSELFENGMALFQINKPDFSEKELENYSLQLPDKYKSKTFLHSDFLKFHSLEELENHKLKYDLAFLSPVFDSISKKGYKSNFNLSEMKEKIKGKNIIALGGIDEDKLEICRQLGFAGVAVCGAIWESKNPLEKFIRIKKICQKTDLVY
ncbi:MAG TPA: thiamine phosphate synthase [Bacteroidia bacterium]